MVCSVVEIERMRIIFAHLTVLKVKCIIVYNHVCKQGYTDCDPTKWLQWLSCLTIIQEWYITHFEHKKQPFNSGTIHLVKQ